TRWVLAKGGSCDQFLTGEVDSSSPFCWPQKDFLWGARDISCVVNRHLDDQLKKWNKDAVVNFGANNAQPVVAPSQGTSSSASDNNNNNNSNTPQTPPPPDTNKGIKNQNTCVGGSICYS